MKKLLLLMMIVSLGVAMADIIPTLNTATAGTQVGLDPEAGQLYSYTYTATLHPNAMLTGSGNEFLTLYDFGGLVGTGITPAGWTYSFAPMGQTPSNITVPETGAPNVTFTYGGPSVSAPQSWSFVLYSTFGSRTDGRLTLTTIPFSAQTTNVNTDVNNRILQNWGYTLGPTPGSGDVNPIPEPMTMALLGAGLAGMGLVRRFRRS